MVKAVQLKAQLELGRQLTREGTELWAVAHAISQLGGDTSNLMAGLASGPSQSGAADVHPPADPGAAAAGRAVRAAVLEGPRAAGPDRPDPRAGPRRTQPPGGRRGP